MFQGLEGREVIRKVRSQSICEYVRNAAGFALFTRLNQSMRSLFRALKMPFYKDLLLPRRAFYIPSKGGPLFRCLGPSPLSRH